MDLTAKNDLQVTNFDHTMWLQSVFQFTLEHTKIEKKNFFSPPFFPGFWRLYRYPPKSRTIVPVVPMWKNSTKVTKKVVKMGRSEVTYMTLKQQNIDVLVS